MTVHDRGNATLQTLLAEQTLSREQFAISKYIGNLRFRRKIRGVDEHAVWAALERLVMLYEGALTAERFRRQEAERKLEHLRCRGVSADG